MGHDCHQDRSFDRMHNHVVDICRFLSVEIVEIVLQTVQNDFLDMLFAQFGDSVARLTSLLSVHLDHPVNAMTAVCKRLALPKKAALEAISMFEMAVGNDEATAHDVFVAMQEIPFTLKTQGVPESKLLALQENMARALTINWRDYDYAKEVKW